MVNYNVFLGGNLRHWPLDSTLDSGVSGPFVPLKYAVHLPRREYMLPFWFDGGNEKWHNFMACTTVGGEGFSVGDTFTAIEAGADHAFGGMNLILKKDLPSGIGLTITAQSKTVDAGGSDQYEKRQIVVAPGTKAGSIYVPPDGTDGDYSNAGVWVIVELTGAAGMDVGTLLDMTQVCFAIRYLAIDFHDETPCSCNRTPCPASYPPVDCLPVITADVSNFTASGVSAAPTSSGTQTTSSGIVGGGTTTSGSTTSGATTSGTTTSGGTVTSGGSTGS